METEYLFEGGLELRAAKPEDDSPGTAVGYGVKWGVKSPPILGPNGQRFTETINRGAFDLANNGEDVLMVAGHREHNVTGSMAARSLDVRDDGVGLKYENKLPPTTLGRDTAVDIARGNIKGTSIAYLPKDKGVAWDFSGDIPHRSINAATLYHISYSSRPAHLGTSAALRSLEIALAERNAAPAAPAADEKPPAAANDNSLSENLLARLRLAELGV